MFRALVVGLGSLCSIALAIMGFQSISAGGSWFSAISLPSISLLDFSSSKEEISTADLVRMEVQKQIHPIDVRVRAHADAQAMKMAELQIQVIDLEADQSSIKQSNSVDAALLNSIDWQKDKKEIEKRLQQKDVQVAKLRQQIIDLEGTIEVLKTHVSTLQRAQSVPLADGPIFTEEEVVSLKNYVRKLPQFIQNQHEINGINNHIDEENWNITSKIIEKIGHKEMRINNSIVGVDLSVWRQVLQGNINRDCDDIGFLYDRHGFPIMKQDIIISHTYENYKDAEKESNRYTEEKGFITYVLMDSVGKYLVAFKNAGTANPKTAGDPQKPLAIFAVV